ncbi:MAG: SDR family NAD(P)-dependent oxidoreductase [Tagaea sp.]|nr:SDR family oxidoreductase [Azospirillum sp.]MCA3265664.1 SDR family oxidoreductase [Azospirillum sp.]MCZ8125195.1 SDR family NAD(P)-dependent oxidoreductase [Magnetospirillum sp.]
MNRIDLTGKRAIVTGGARGIGLAIAARLLASGAVVTLWDRDAPALDAAVKRLAGSGEVHTAAVDVTDDAAVTAATNRTLGAMGGIEILINNAGITGPNATTWEYPVAEWRKVIEVDLTAPFLCCRAVVPHLVKAGWGRIVNIASVAGKEGNPNAPAYSAAKAGLIGLTKSLGKELAKSNVLVNCVTPAVAETDILKQMTEAHVAFMLGKIPMGRFVQIDEIAALVLWLASAECSFSTGAVFDITGGRSTY